MAQSAEEKAAQQAEKDAAKANAEAAQQAEEAAHGSKVKTEEQVRAERAKAGAGKNRTADGKVRITLAHPISRKQDKQYLGLDVESAYEVGDTVEVTPAGAASLIGAGLAAVDTEDPAAVRAAINGT